MPKLCSLLPSFPHSPISLMKVPRPTSRRISELKSTIKQTIAMSQRRSQMRSKAVDTEKVVEHKAGPVVKCASFWFTSRFLKLHNVQELILMLGLNAFPRCVGKTFRWWWKRLRLQRSMKLFHRRQKGRIRDQDPRRLWQSPLRSESF